MAKGEANCETLNMTTTLALSIDYANNNNNSSNISSCRYANNNNNNNSSNKNSMYKFNKAITDDLQIGSSSSSCSPLPSPHMTKSNSYNGSISMDAAALISCDSGDLEGSNSSPAALGTSVINVNLDSGEGDTFLINASRRSNSRTTNYLRRNTCWMQSYGFIMRHWYFSYLLPICVLALLFVVAYLTRDYAKQLLFWIETQNSWLIFVIYLGLFTVVSFPFALGYLVLLITAGYLFGVWRGWLTVILGANLGIAIAHLTIRSVRHQIPVHKLIKNETGRAILRVISGPKAFRVVLFTRLTPIPFGLQNVIFGISSINARDYHAATFLGLLPAQTINVYLGSTLRSMHEVLNDNHTKLTGYISFALEVICGVALMVWVVQKARKELSETLLTSEYNNDGKPIDIQV
ncbi:transmembrane protein 64 [Drosophila busckii]|uniref:transmembrane protein 64 n=1 Tax=Drosophila busckii TaxID=30019 RepID=UPI00083ECA75|nr:transmembrane protein 64 [Drosophila busckii]